MKYQIIPPPVHLSEYVRFFWILESNTSYIHRALADGGVEMIFHYRGSFDEISPSGKIKSAFSELHGPSSSYRTYECATDFGIFGVYLYPYAIPNLFDTSSNELSDGIPDLLSFFGQQGHILEEQMISASNNADRVKIVSGFLEEKLKESVTKEPKIQYMINLIIQSKGRIDIDLLAENCCISRRQFERKFKDYAGFSPKMYARIARFQHAANEYNNRGLSLAQLALECGY